MQPSEINQPFRFNDQIQKQGQRKPVRLPYNVEQTVHSNTQVQTVEPTLGITPDQHYCIHNNPDTVPAEILETKPVKDYAETNIKTLDGIVVQQPKRFLPLAQEAKRLADKIRKEEIAAQWAGILPEKLLDTSFVAQLNQLQALKQIAPLQQAKEQLPNDIIEILELLGKSDNVPISQLYLLADRCADRYYTQVITAIVELFKRHLIDRQTVLVNTARALKYLEQYSQRQSKLWKILSKCEDLLDHFHDLKQSITQEFNYLKKATSLNVQDLNKHITAQETFNSTLSSHINIIHTRLAQLALQVTQGHMSQENSSNDYVELTCPDFDPALDGPIAVALHADTSQKGTTNTGGFENEDTNRIEDQPRPVSPRIPETLADLPSPRIIQLRKSPTIIIGTQKITTGNHQHPDP